MKHVLVIGPLRPETKEEFSAIPGYVFTFCENRSALAEEALAEAEVIVGPVTPELVKKAPKLTWIQLFSAGVNDYAWLPDSILLTNAYGAYGASIAEHMLACTLMVMKRFPDYYEGQRERRWQLLHDIQRLEGSTVVSVGMGSIGTEYLRRVHALGAHCYGVRRTVHDRPDFVEGLFTPDEMDPILAEADVVALSLPGTGDTDGLFDEKRLRGIRKGAILINVGRGNSIVTGDLIRLMEEGHFKGACLDVMDPDPLPPEHPLWSTPGVYITPHVSGGFRAGVNYDRVMSVVKENLRRVAEGRSVLHAVDRQLGY